jgi:hypothetical protein
MYKMLDTIEPAAFQNIRSANDIAFRVGKGTL